MQRQELSSDTTALEPIPCGYDVVQSHKVLAQGDFILPFFCSQTDLSFEKKLNMSEKNNIDTWNNIKQRGSWEERKIFFPIMRFLAWDQGGLLLHRAKNYSNHTLCISFKSFFLSVCCHVNHRQNTVALSIRFHKNTKTLGTYCIGEGNSLLRKHFAQDFQKWMEIVNYSHFRYLASDF